LSTFRFKNVPTPCTTGRNIPQRQSGTQVPRLLLGGRIRRYEKRAGRTGLVDQAKGLVRLLGSLVPLRTEVAVGVAVELHHVRQTRKQPLSAEDQVHPHKILEQKMREAGFVPN